MAENIRSIGSNGKFSIGNLFPVYSQATGSNMGNITVGTTIKEIYRFIVSEYAYYENAACIVPQVGISGYQEGTARPVYINQTTSPHGIVLTYDMINVNYAFYTNPYNNITFYAKLLHSDDGKVELVFLAKSVTNNNRISIGNIGFTAFVFIDQTMADGLNI